MIPMDIPTLQDIHNFMDTVFIEPKSMVDELSNNEFDRTYLLNHLPFESVLFKRKDGRCYYFSDDRNFGMGLWDFTIGYGESMDFMLMASIRWNTDLRTLEVVLDEESKNPYMFLLLPDKYYDFRTSPKDLKSDISSHIALMEQKTNAVLTLLYLMTLIPPQHIKKNVIKLRTVEVERTGGIKRKNIKHIRKTEYTVNSMDNLLKSPRAVEYTTKSWTTRGHFRLCKSGNKVWVKPHQSKRSKNLLSTRCIDKQSIYMLGNEVKSENGKDNTDI